MAICRVGRDEGVVTIFRILAGKILLLSNYESAV